MITTLALLVLLFLGEFLNCDAPRSEVGITTSVLLPEVDGHEGRKNEGHGEGGNEKTVALEIAGSIGLAVGETSDGTTKVTKTNVHGNTNGTFGGSTNVVSVPGDTHGDVGVDTACREEGTSVLNTRSRGGNQHDETDDTNHTEEDHIRATSLLAVGEVTASDGAKTGNNVGGDGHELRLLVGVAHVLDDGRKEERDGVERGVDADGDQHVDPDLPVLESMEKVLDVVLISKRGAVLLQTAGDLDALIVIQEVGTNCSQISSSPRIETVINLRGRVISNGPLGEGSNDESGQTLDDENPGPT